MLIYGLNYELVFIYSLNCELALAYSSIYSLNCELKQVSVLNLQVNTNLWFKLWICLDFNLQINNN